MEDVGVDWIMELGMLGRYIFSEESEFHFKTRAEAR
jgi:hypothetical protein